MITEEKEVPLLTNREVGEALEPGLPRRVWNESKKLWRIVGPAIFLRTTSYSMTLVTQAFAGHLGDLELAAMSLGMASALETLCGQAYGAKKHHMLGVYLQRSWIVLLGCAVLLLPLYIQATPLLELMGEPAELAREAGRVCIWFIPMHLSFAFLFPLNRFFQSQLKNSVSAVASGLVLAVHIFLSWLVVYKLDQGLRGASLTLCFSWWLQVLGQFAYVVCGGCPQTWKGFSMDAFLELWEFVKLSAASGVMLCLENWYYRVLILLTGSLKNAEIAVDAISICMNINNWELMIPLAFFAGTGCSRGRRVASNGGFRKRWIGVWAGMIGGTAVQTVVLIYLTMRCDWDKELGMASALETLCGQAYGAKKHHMLGVYLQRSWIVLFGCAVLLLPLYIQATPLLELVVKPAELAREAGRVCIWFIPMHLSFAFLFPLNRFFQSQLKNSVSAVASGLVLAVHIFLSWLVVYKLDQGLRGASLTLCFSWWLQVLGQFAYVVCGGCPQTWKGFSMDAFLELWEFVKLSAASGVMLCLENWYYVVLILLPGSLKNAEIAVDAISICMTVNNWELMIPLAFFAGTGVRVANELGAGNSRGAKFATVVSLVTSTVIGLFNFCVIVVLHDKFALIFSSSTAVLDAVDKLNLLLAIPIQLNSIQPILSGVAVGAGWQATVAYVNVGSYYLIGIPVGVIMGWVFHLGVRGVWAGMIGGTAVQTVVLIYLTMRCDWDKEALKASERMEKWTISREVGEALEPGLPRRVWNESKKLWRIVGPAIFLRTTSYSMTLVTQAFAGHLGDLELAAILAWRAPWRPSAAKPTARRSTTCWESTCSARGSSSWDAPCSSSHYTSRPPRCWSWWEPAELAREAGRVCIWFIPMHLSFAFLFPLNRFFQSQLKNSVSAVASGLVLAVHIFLSWLVVYKLDQGLRGASLTLCFSWWLQVLGQFAYVVCGGCPQTWKGFSMDAFLELWEFVKLSAASGVMLCLENWYYRVLILLTGSLKNAEIAVDAISICMNINNWELMIPLAFFAGTGVRVANELGAGNSRGAKFATVVSVVTSTVIGLFSCCVIVVFLDKFALIFSSSTVVLDAVDKLSLLLAIAILLNSIQPILSGVAVGAGWQATVAFVNVGSYYLISIPVRVIMGWVFHLGIRGVWAGMIGGTAVQTVVLIHLTMRCDWDKEALKASARMEKWAIVARRRKRDDTT
ncbi:protein TRANSPARENT TESTA [Musa troglodytarum]|uniref:Protein DETOXIFICATION n=1 Tax=Musa troglodytarum TaxID=320322 RepID=A0A9E7L6L9_9LILI|nr:protein TRANSPARENT TESTA [Musa troglodytarum]